MSDFKRSDLWFGSLVAIFFAAAAFLFFGNVVSSALFWSQLLFFAVSGGLAIVARNALTRFTQPVMTIGLFVVGASLASVFLYLASGPMEAGQIFTYGCLFALIDVVFPKKSGDEQVGD